VAHIIWKVTFCNLLFLSLLMFAFYLHSWTNNIHGSNCSQKSFKWLAQTFFNAFLSHISYFVYLILNIFFLFSFIDKYMHKHTHAHSHSLKHSDAQIRKHRYTVGYTDTQMHIFTFLNICTRLTLSQDIYFLYSGDFVL
jgi:hypothetical protein